MLTKKWITLAALAISAVLPASAERYMLIFQSGEKPNRCAFFAQMESAVGKGDLRPLTVLEIYENAEGPFASEFQAEFRVSDAKCRLVKGIDFFRDDERTKEYSHPGWQDIPYNWQRRAFEFAAQDQAWRTAFEMDLQQEKLTGKSSRQSALVAQQCLFVGQHWWPSSLDAFTYQNLWTDASRPKFTSSKPKEVQEKERADLIAYLEWASRTLGGFVTSGKEQIQEMERQRQIEKLKAECAARRPYSSLNKTLESWIGVSEQALVAQEGKPHFFKVENGVRCLTYSSTRSEDLVRMSSNGVQKIGQNDYRCDITYFVLHGVIYDFVVSGNDPSI